MIAKIILAIGRIQNSLRRVRCEFKIGDMVELKDGTGYPMLITQVNHTKNMKEPLLYCRWYDRQTKETRLNFFPTSKVKMFDWQTAPEPR